MSTEKTIYFVRHGESTTNASGVRQGPESLLTALGERQAEALGRRLAGLPFDLLVHSPYTRARHTTAIARQHVGETPVVESALFVERRNPSILIGTHESDPAMKHVWEAIAANYGKSGWRHSDEETFDELILRAKTALRFLEERPEGRIVVVGHGMFSKVILAHVLLGERLDGRTFWECFIPAKNIANTGIMRLDYAERYDKQGMYWKLVSWNDHAHLSPELLSQ